MIHEVHTVKGRHEVQELAFPEWVPAQVQLQAEKLTEAQAISVLGKWSAPLFSGAA